MVVVVVVSHSQRVGCQPERTTLHGGGEQDRCALAVGGINKWTSPSKAGGIPRVSTISSQGVENEWAYAGRDGGTLSRDSRFLRRERGTGEKHAPCSFPC